MLVIDRFKLQAHTENRPLNAYTLVAVKPKLRKADPAARTRWQDDATADTKGRGAAGRMVTCQNVTMTQFAAMLPGIAPGYIRTEVVDGTGLEGGWDFTFRFSPQGAVQISNAQRPVDGEASDPTGAISLFEAVARQLGLKLETQKRPMPVVVIDHIERTPTEN